MIWISYNTCPQIKRSQKFYALLVDSIMNVFLCLYFGITGDESSTASNHLLVIFVVNLIFYYTYYAIMKYSRGERLHISSSIYFCFGIMFMVPSIYFFTQVFKCNGKNIENFYFRKKRILPYPLQNPGTNILLFILEIVPLLLSVNKENEQRMNFLTSLTRRLSSRKASLHKVFDLFCL